MADRQFVAPFATSSAPADWVLPANLQIQPKIAFAHFNGASAAGAYLPVLRIISDSGHVAAEAVSATSVAAGASADVSWFLGVARQAASTSIVRTLNLVINGNGATITTGVAGDVELDFAATILRWTLLADRSGSIVVNVWKTAYAGFPPTVANKITASAPPTITTAQNAQSSTLTGWTTAISAGDTLRFNVDSVTSIQRVTLALDLQT